MDPFAQVFQAGTLVARIFGDEFRHHTPQRLVHVVGVFELLQLCHQGVPAAFGDADGEHDEEGVQASLLDDDAVLGEILGEDVGRNAPLTKVAFDIQAWHDQCGFDRVEHVEARREVAEAVPVFVGSEYPLLLLRHAFVGNVFRAPDFEPPFVIAKLVVDFAHRTTEIQRLANGFFDQRGAARRFHHRGSHIATGNDGVLRRSRHVHQIGLVEQVAVKLAAFGFLHQNLTRLAQACQQFVGRLG